MRRRTGAAEGLAHGVASGLAGGGGGVRPETAAVAAAMIQPPSALRLSLMDALVGAVQACGAWARLDGLFVTAAHDLQAATINWVAPAGTRLTPVNSPIFTPDVGFEGDGATSYLETGLVQGTGLYAPADHHAGVWINGGATVSTVWGNIRNRIQPHSAEGELACRSNATASLGAAVADGHGHSGFRTEAGRFAIFKNGVRLAEPAQEPTAAVNQPFLLLGYGGDSGPVSLSAWRVAAAHSGAGLGAAQMTAMAAALAAYLEAVTP